MYSIVCVKLDSRLQYNYVIMTDQEYVFSAHKYVTCIQILEGVQFYFKNNSKNKIHVYNS